MDSDRADGEGSGALEKLAKKLSEFMSEVRGAHSHHFLLSLAQLCYHDTQLAYSTWVELFPKVWTLLTDRQRQVGGA